MPPRSLTESLRETLAHFEVVGPPRTTTEVAERLDLGRRSTYERLRRLVDCDALETKKVGASGRVWWRPQPADAHSSARTPSAESPSAHSARRPSSSQDEGDPAWNPPAAVESSIDDVFNGADIGVFVLDEHFDVAWLNAAAERYFGLERDQVVGLNKPTLVEDQIADVMADGGTFADTVLGAYDDNTYVEEFECRVTAGEGREARWLEHHSEPIRSGVYAGGRVELYYDVTEQKCSERAHRTGREEFESLIDAVEEYSIVTLDSEGRVRTWNPGAERITGYAADDVVGEHASVFYTAEDRESGVPDRDLSRAASSGSLEGEGWRVCADGSRFWATVSITAIRDGEDLTGFAMVTRDMTDRRERERELRRERDLTDRLLETVPFRLAIFRPDGSIERMNSATKRQFGIDESDESTYRIEDLNVYDPDGTPIDPGDHPVPTVVETGEPVTDWLVQNEGPDGHRRWVSLTAAPVFGGDGSLERVVVAGKDITELKRTQEQLERQRDELRAELDDVFERVDDGFIALDSELRFTYVNEYAADLLEFSEADVLGTPIWDVLEPGPNAREVLETTLESQDRRSFEQYYEPLDTWFELHLYPSESGLSVYFRDVSERKRREREIVEARRRYRTVVENFPNGVVALVDQDLRYITYGGKLDSVSDVSREAVEGEPVREAVPSVLADVVAPRYEAALQGEHASFEESIGDGIYQFYFIPVRDEDGEIFAAMGMSQDVTERTERERELERQREQLVALNTLNTVVHGITEEVIEQSTRDEIERIVCEHLAQTDSYLFAWIGDVDVASQTVNLRTEAGVEGYLDDITISVDPADERSDGPTGRAFLERELQTAQNVDTDPRHDPWRRHVDAHGVRSSAAIPIVHEDTLYGVLNVYAERPNAFEGQERTVISQLGEFVGHAIAATERKRALMSDDVVELQFRIRDFFGEFDVDPPADGTITFDHTIPIEGDEYLAYGTTTAPKADVAALVDRIPHWDAVTYRTDANEGRFELRLSEPPVVSTVASVAGSVHHAVIEDGDYQMTIHLAPGADVRTVVDAVEETYSRAELQKHRQVERRDGAAERVRHALRADLTDRQRVVLDAAYHAGFFEWPRDASGEDVAESLDITPPTFHQHLRRAQQKLLASLLSPSPSVDRSVAD